MIRKTKNFIAGMLERKLTVYASSGCYYLFMSLVPIVMILCCLLPYTPFTQDLLLEYLDDYMTPQLTEMVKKIVDAVYASSAATLTFSICLTAFSASASMKALMKGMDAAYGVERKDGFLLFTIKGLLYMTVLLVALVLTLFVLVYGERILELVQNYVPQIFSWETLINLLRYAVTFLLLVLFFLILYTLMPAGKHRVARNVPGAIFTAVLWTAFSSVFSFYMDNAWKYGAYGYIGSTMAAMLWMYCCLYFLLIGGYINSRRREKKI